MQLPGFLIRSMSLALVANAATAAVIGTNQPALPLTLARIAQLPVTDQTSWQTYWETSVRQDHADRSFLREELKRLKLTQPIAPPAGRGSQGLSLDREADWYRSVEARRVAEIIVSFQTPAGGWSKNLDLTKHIRAPGEHFAQANLSRYATPTDLDQPHDPDWNYVGTFDNGATTTQMRYLAKVIAALPPAGHVQLCAIATLPGQSHLCFLARVFPGVRTAEGVGKMRHIES